MLANMRKGADEALVAWAKERGLFVRIDRRSAWGNPHKISRHQTRDEVCDAYAADFPDRADLQARLGELRGKVLGCWCKPEDCHGDVLVELIEAGDTE